jgi:hypothetical protein
MCLPLRKVSLRFFSSNDISVKVRFEDMRSVQPTLVPRKNPTPDPQREGIVSLLQGTISARASSQEVANTVAAALRDIDEVLAPVIGQRGVAALYRRTIHLSGRAYPWLLTGHSTDASAQVDITALNAGLARQTAVDAVAAGAEVLLRLHELLASLIGTSLAERLLLRVGMTSKSGPPDQEQTPWPKK